MKTGRSKLGSSSGGCRWTRVGRLLAEALGNGNNLRLDMLLRNSRGFGWQVILDVSMTGINGQS